ncbi:MAG TPA: sugar transferase [Capillimicrobium sp.]|jgi:exopolysaccharide biosynthesis polyprenyl glycosylphosphotransferase
MPQETAHADRRTEEEQPAGGIPYVRASTYAPPGVDMRRKKPPALSFLLRMETLRRAARVASLLAIDVAAIFLAIFTALALKEIVLGQLNTTAVWHQTKEIVTFACLLTLLLFARSDLYADRASRPGLTRIVASLFQVTVVALIFALISGEDFTSYYIFYGSLFFAVLYVAGFRYVYENATGLILRAAGYQRRAVLVGTGQHIEAVAHALGDGGRTPIHVVGFVSLTPRPDNGLKSLGRFEALPDVLREYRIDEVIIADPDFPQERAVELVDRCHVMGVRVRIAPSTMEILVHRAEFVPGQSVPLFELKPPVFEGFDYVLKRTFDIVGSSLLLLALSPLLIASALAVRLSSRGPVLYHSIRPGVGGRPFACFKFRTMYHGADLQQAELEAMNEAGGAIFKIRDDPRVTPVGRFLRRYSIDELPQLMNVLRGEMSLVGPRPLPERDFARLEEWHKKRYLVMPGITGLWQVSGRSELDFDDLVRLDFLYLERWSVFLDFTILLKTVPAVLTRRGAF